MSRISLSIEKVVLRGFEPAERTAVLDGLQTELRRVLADAEGPAAWAKSHHIPRLKLGRMPLSPRPSGGRDLGARIAGAIGRGLKR